MVLPGSPLLRQRTAAMSPTTRWAHILDVLSTRLQTPSRRLSQELATRSIWNLAMPSSLRLQPTRLSSDCGLPQQQKPKVCNTHTSVTAVLGPRRPPFAHHLLHRTVWAFLPVAICHCLSLKGKLAQQLMHAGLCRRGIQLASFQETRVKQTEIHREGQYWVASSPCTPQGVGGCQIWFHATAQIAHSAQGGFGWERTSFAKLHCHPQLLAVSVLAQAGPVKVAVLPGHAPTAKATAPEREDWWQMLASTLKRIPQGYIPLLCLDANARFIPDAGHSDTLDVPADGPNAELLVKCCRDFHLHPSPQFDPLGNPLVSWISPAGKPALLDYFLCPRGWAAALKVENSPTLADAHATIDHRPLRARLCCTLCLGQRQKRKHINAGDLRTPMGEAAVKEAFRTLPLIPWSVDSTTHVQPVHEHLHHVLSSQLPRPVTRPRNPAYSEGTVALVHQKRRARKRSRELSYSERRLVLQSLFDAIRGETSFALSMPRPGSPIAVSLTSIRSQSLAVTAAVHRLTRELGTKMQIDKAEFLRQEMAHARDLGSAHFAFRIRAVLRTGRKFKSPALLPVLQQKDQTEAAGQHAVLHALGSHYASGTCP